jgi:hypothetical protein
MPIRKRPGLEAGQGCAPRRKLRRLNFDKKVVNVEEPTAAEVEAARLDELAERVEVLEGKVRELSITVEEHEAEIDHLKKLVNGNGDIATRMARTADEVAESLERVNRLMQTLSAMVGTVIPLFQQLDRPQPRGLIDCLRRIQEEHDHIRLVVLPRAEQDAANTELSIAYVDAPETRH